MFMRRFIISSIVTNLPALDHHLETTIDTGGGGVETKIGTLVHIFTSTHVTNTFIISTSQIEF